MPACISHRADNGDGNVRPANVVAVGALKVQAGAQLHRLVSVAAIDYRRGGIHDAYHLAATG